MGTYTNIIPGYDNTPSSDDFWPDDASEVIFTDLEQLHAYISSVLSLTDAAIRTAYSGEDFDFPDLTFPGVSWETITAGEIESYIESARALFVYPPTIPDIDTGDAPTISIPDVVLPKDSTLLDAIKNKLKNNISNGSYGLETADASGIASRSLDRATKISSSMTGNIPWAVSSFGIQIPNKSMLEMSNNLQLGLYNQVVPASDRSVAIGVNNSYTEDYRNTREQGIRLAAWILEEYIKEIEALVFAFEAQVDGYTKKLEGKSLVIKGEYDEYSARIKAFAATADAVAKVGELSTKNMDTSMDIYKECIKLAVDNFKLAVNKLISLDGLYLQTAVNKITAMAGVAAAALSQYNASMSTGSSVGDNISSTTSWQVTTATGHSAQNEVFYSEVANVSPEDISGSTGSPPIP